jgi:hypothetical protein
LRHSGLAVALVANVVRERVIVGAGGTVDGGDVGAAPQPGIEGVRRPAGEAGKGDNVIISAVARKLVVIAYAILLKQQPWQPQVA